MRFHAVRDNEGESEVGSTEGGANCGLHPLIHTLGSRKDTTTYGGGSKRARVWIKVEFVD